MAATAPPSAKPRRPASHSDDELHVPLRLSVARGVLALELYEPIEVGPVEVRTLSSALPGLKFPIDLSGGVRVFRHRRGRLERMELALSLDRLANWLRPRLREMLGGLTRPVALWAVDQGVGVGLVGSDSAVAFELLWVPLDDNARFVVTRARGAGLGAPALAVALQVVDTALGGVAERRGRLVSFPSAGLSLARRVLPAVGARAPSTAATRFDSWFVAGDEIGVVLDAETAPPALTDAALRALELSSLAAAADDLLAKGELDDARARYVTLLERAPRQAEVAQIIAEIDRYGFERAEGALSVLAETLELRDFGAVGAELLARTGELVAAREALEVASRLELFGPVAALWWLRLAELQPDPAREKDWLDRAVTHAPGLESPRWARLGFSIRRGDVRVALADAEHLEALSSGSLARHAACCRAAGLLLQAGFVPQAGRLYERALRYLPDDPQATVGLGQALLEAGKSQRAFALLSRAVQLGEQRGSVSPEGLLALAKVLATHLDDRPQAIARVRQVPGTSACGLEARYLEGRWRAEIGDQVGASLAFARARDVTESTAPEEPATVSRWLLEAARFEWDQKGDLKAAYRHAASALKLQPSSVVAAALFRQLAQERAKSEPGDVV